MPRGAASGPGRAWGEGSEGPVAVRDVEDGRTVGRFAGNPSGVPGYDSARPVVTPRVGCGGTGVGTTGGGTPGGPES